MDQELFYGYYWCLTEEQFIYPSLYVKGVRKFGLRKWIAKRMVSGLSKNDATLIHIRLGGPKNVNWTPSHRRSF